MSFLKAHHRADGRTYFSISESYRDNNGKVRHRYIQYVGAGGRFGMSTPVFTPMRPKDIGADEVPKHSWIAEEKYDGVRTLAYVNKKGVAFINRRDVNKTERYPELTNINKQLKFKDNVVLDGEVVVFRDSIDDFSALAGRDHLKDKKVIFQRSKEDPLTFIAFDVLSKDGKSLLNAPLEERKKILDETIPDTLKNIREIKFSTDPAQYVRQLRKKRSVEGVVFKREDSVYEQGPSNSWKKFKFTRENDVAILGYTPGIGKRKDTFGALIMGIWGGKKYRFVGKVGTGFDVEQEKDIKERLVKLKSSKPDIEGSIHEKNITWVKPSLVARVKFAKIASQGSYREPSFQGLREDISPKQTHPVSKQFNAKSDIGDTWKKSVNGVVKEKIWDHYDGLWNKLKPQLKDRFVVVRAYHGDVPVIMRHFPGPKKGLIRIKDKEDLKELVRMHAFEIIPELSTISDPDHTDRLLIDLDTKGAKRGEIKNVTKDILDYYKSRGDVKRTRIVHTGGKGYHVWAYLKNKLTWKKARKDLKDVQLLLKNKYPEIVELNLQATKRRKSFILPDISSVKKHGAARAIGSLHGKSLAPSHIVRLQDITREPIHEA